jgi:hypothetical protein
MRSLFNPDLERLYAPISPICRYQPSRNPVSILAHVILPIDRSHILARLLPEGGMRLLFCLVLSAIALWFAQSRYSVLTRFLEEKASPLNLGVARAAVFAGLVLMVGFDELLAFGNLDSSLILPPFGWKWIAPHIPRSTYLLQTVYVLLVISGFLAVIGLWTRASTILASLSGFYVLTIPQLFGQVVHYNHLVLFAFLLAASPCGDALSVDAWLRSRRLGRIASMPEPSTYYAAPLKIMMLLMGIAYYFAGIWKVCRVGMRWFTPDYMRLILLIKMQEFHTTSLQRWALMHPLMLALGAIFTVVFEVGFVFAILDRRWRVVALIAGLAFHNMTYMLMEIQFLDMQACYVVLVDWAAIIAVVRAGLRTESASSLIGATANENIPEAGTAFRILAFVSVIGMLIGGATHIVNGWPLGCYPTFDWQPNSLVTELGFELHAANGAVEVHHLDFDHSMAKPYSSERWKSLVAEVTRPDIPYLRARSKALLSLWAAANHRSDIRSAALYLDVYDFSRSTTIPVQHHLIDTITIESQGQQRISSHSLSLLYFKVSPRHLQYNLACEPMFHPGSKPGADLLVITTKKGDLATPADFADRHHI